MMSEHTLRIIICNKIANFKHKTTCCPFNPVATVMCRIGHIFPTLQGVFAKHPFESEKSCREDHHRLIVYCAGNSERDPARHQTQISKSNILSLITVFMCCRQPYPLEAGKTNRIGDFSNCIISFSFIFHNFNGFFVS